MVKFSKNDEIDVEIYGDSLNRRGYILIDKNEAVDSLSYLQSRYQTLANRALFTIKLKSGCRFFTLDKVAIYKYLTMYEGCPERYFHTGKTQSFSLDKNRVLDKLVSNGKAVEFLKLYMEHRSVKSKYSSLKSLLNVCNQQHGMDYKGHALYKVPFEASVQKNLRFNYRQCDIISQIPKSICDVISVEDGYFLAWGDFAQSDFRIAYNLFIRSEENDAIMEQYEDKYEALARIVNKKLGKEFDFEKFQEDRKMYKRLTLATVYGTRSSVVPEEQDFIKMFTEFLMQCPKYAEYVRRLEEHLLMKSPIAVYSYFGHEQFIYVDTYEKNSMVYDALNSPVQTGTSEIVIRTVNSILNMARACGLDEDQFDIYLTRHDEPVFRIRKDAINYLWILEEHSRVLVDDWSELAIDFDYGYHYKQPDEELRALAARCIEQHKDRITVLKPGKKIDTEYYPIKPLFIINIHWIPVEESGNTIVVFSQQNTNKAIFSIFETLDEEEIIHSIRLRIKDAEPDICSVYAGVFVRNNFFSKEDYFGNTHVVYRQEISPNLNTAVRLCKGMVNMYCRKNRFTIPDSCPTPLPAFPEELSILIPSKPKEGAGNG